MSWLEKKGKGITTPTSEKKDIPKGLWQKTPSGKEVNIEELKENLYVSADDNYHFKINSKKYFEILFDNFKYKPIGKNLSSIDFLKFEDTKKYKDRIKENIKKTGFDEAISVGYGKLNGKQIVIACMNFNFIGGSMGSVVGQRICLGIDHCIKNKTPLLIISKSGGARMMESSFSLMQMAKTCAKLTMLSEAKIPFISLLTNPTMGGVSASFAMLGDINIAEPEALIGFAGQRVIKETLGKELPKGFQTAEFLLENGFLDFIVHRKDLKSKIYEILKLLYYK